MFRNLEYHNEKHHCDDMIAKVQHQLPETIDKINNFAKKRHLCLTDFLHLAQIFSVLSTNNAAIRVVTPGNVSILLDGDVGQFAKLEEIAKVERQDGVFPTVAPDFEAFEHGTKN